MNDDQIARGMRSNNFEKEIENYNLYQFMNDTNFYLSKWYKTNDLKKYKTKKVILDQLEEEKTMWLAMRPN